VSLVFGPSEFGDPLTSALFVSLRDCDSIVGVVSGRTELASDL
jgi:hypothetical protein